jgi:hypothetical protein
MDKTTKFKEAFKVVLAIEKNLTVPKWFVITAKES